MYCYATLTKTSPKKALLMWVRVHPRDMLMLMQHAYHDVTSQIRKAMVKKRKKEEKGDKVNEGRTRQERPSTWCLFAEKNFNRQTVVEVEEKGASL